MKHEQYNDREKILVRSLALAITQCLRETLENESHCVGVSGHYTHHMYQSDFEIACDALWRLQVSKSAFGKDRGPAGFSFDEFANDTISLPGKMFPPYFSLCTDQELDNLITNSNPETWPSLGLIIEAYLRVATDYGPSRKTHLPLPRNELFFITHPDQKAPMDALVMNGYAKKSGQQYAWTSKMDFIMLENWLWDETSIDRAAVDDDKMLSETFKIFESLQQPEASQLSFNLQNLSITFRGIEILGKWDGKSWSSDRLTNPYLTMDEAIAISSELYTRIATAKRTSG